MSLTHKVIRKLGLGDAVSRLFSPLASDSAPLPSPEAARASLTALRPDTGSSALAREPLLPASGEYEVDVIIPVYNAAAYLADCLASVLSQKTSFRFRVIAVDDGSTDGSSAILDDCSDPRLTVIHQENAGAAAARNCGILASRAPWLCFLDADDLMSPDCLESLLNCARETGADLVEAGYNTVSAENLILSTCVHQKDEMNARDCNGFPWGKLWPRSLFSAARFPTGYGFEDSVLAQLLLPMAERSALRVTGLDFPAFRYRLHGQNITQRSRGTPAGIDSLWITFSLYRDRQVLGLENDRRYYEYLLNMLVLTWHRTEALGDDVGRAVFVLSREFLLREFAAFGTERPAYRMLEEAVRDGDYGRYRLFCSLH